MLHTQWEERLVHYQYIQELLEDRRVLELGCGSGLGARFLADLASQVLVVDPREQQLESCRNRLDLPNVRWLRSEPDRLQLEPQSIDVVLVPELLRWVTRGTLLPEIQRVLAPDGVVLAAVPSGDRGGDGGMAFDDFHEYLAHAFEHVRLMGEIPFFGKIIADYDPEEDLEPQLDCSLVEEDELPLFYLGICSREPLSSLGYSVLQIPREGAQIVETVPLSERAKSVMEAWTESETLPESGPQSVSESGPEMLPESGPESVPETLPEHELESLPVTLVASAPETTVTSAPETMLDAPITTTFAAESRSLAVLERLLDRESVRAEGLEERLHQERNRLERERLRVEELNQRLLEDRGKIEGERVRAEVAERALEEWRLAVEEQRNRAEAAERRCDSLLIRLEQGAGELSSLHHQMAELQGLRQADRWHIDELTGQLRQQEIERARDERPSPAELEQRTLEADRHAGEVAELEKRIVELEQRAAEAEKRAVQSEHRASMAVRQAEETSKQIARGDRRIKELEQQAVQRQEEMTELERELMRSESRVTEHSRRATNAESKIVQMEVRLKRSESEAATLSKWAEELREELKEAQGKSSARPVTPEPEVAALRNDLDQARQRNTDLEQRCDRFMAEAEQSKAQLEEKDRVLQEALNTVDADLLQEVMQLRQQSEELKILRQQQEETMRELENVHDQLRDAEQAETELNRTRRELQNLRQRVRDIDEASEELEQLRMAAIHQRESQQELLQVREELEAARIELARYEDELRAGASGITQEAALEEEEAEEKEYEGYVGIEMEGVLDVEGDEDEWDVDERIRVREHQLEALLEGASLHREEMEQQAAQLAEMDALVQELQSQQQLLEQQLADRDSQLSTEQQSLQEIRDENARLCRELARVQGELQRCQEGRSQAEPREDGAVVDTPLREDLEREIRLRQKLQEDLETRLVELDELRKEQRTRDKAMDRLRAEDTEHRAELRELRRQVRDMERQVATWREALGEREQRIRALEGQLKELRTGEERPADQTQPAELERLGLKLNRALKEARQLENKLEQERDLRAEANLEIERRQAEVERQKEQLSQSDTHVECMREELSKARILLETTERELGVSREQQQQAEQSIQVLRGELTQCRERVRKLESKLDERKERIKQLKRTLEHEQRLVGPPRRPEGGAT